MLCLSKSVLGFTHREKGEDKAAPEVCVCVHCGTNHLEYSSKRGRKLLDSSDLQGLVFLAWSPIVAHAQLGPGDGHLVHARGAHFWIEVDDAAVILHVLKFVLLGGLHVDHRVLVDMLL